MYQERNFPYFKWKKQLSRSISQAFLSCLLIISSTSDTTYAANNELFSADDVLNFSPRAKNEFVIALVENQNLLSDVGINTKLHIAHFFAQIATETGGMRRLDENMSYTIEGMLKTFKGRVTFEKAKEIVGKPIEIANWVYGDRLGNLGRQTNDGWNYRGSGFIQLTGRENYRKRGDEVSLPLEERPELARQPIEGLKAATAYWKAKNVNNAVAENNIHKVRILVNGKKAEGLPQAKIWFSKASKVFGVQGGTSQEDIILAEAGTESESIKATAQALQELGFLTVQESSEGNEQAVANGLKAYQKSRGLKETGILDEDTLYAITDPQEWRGDKDEEETQEVIPNTQVDPEGTYIFDVENNKETIVDLNKDFSKNKISIIKGTGEVNPHDKYDLTEQEVSALGDTITAYAPYEIAEGKKNERGTFIPHSVIGDDDRQLVEDTSTFPSRAIVQILFTSPSDGLSRLCTGALISSNTVLTAGHCVHSGTSSGSWYTKHIVYPGRNTGSKPFGSCLGKNLFTLGGWKEATSSKDARPYDLGAIKLDCNIGERTGWFDLKTIGNDSLNEQTTIQGYPADLPPAGRQWKSVDMIRNIKDLNIFYQNDTFGGMSGSPVFDADNNTIFAIHTSGLHGEEPWKSNNGATRITSERLKTINYWREH